MDKENPNLTKARIVLTVVGAVIALVGAGLTLMGGLDLVMGFAFHLGSLYGALIGLVMALGGAYTIWWSWASYPKIQ